MKLDKRKHLFEIQLNSISDTDNPTKKEVEFVLHDFLVSKNNAFISKETAEKTLATLKDMPIVAKYYEVSEPGADDDALGSHELYLDEDRKTGDMMFGLGTVPIGVFTEPAYIKTIKNENDEDIEVVAGKGILWSSRFPNVIGLLQQWLDEGINVVSSMEILYDEFHVKDGVEEILNFVYEGHCVLNSVDRGDHKKVNPAYDVSKLTKLVAQAISKEKEDEKMSEKHKIVFELSHDDIRSKLYNKLEGQFGEDQWAWVVSVYDNHFIVNVYGDGEDKYYKVDYTSSEDDVTVDLDSKVEVVEERNWVAKSQVEELETQLNTATTDLETTKNQLNEVTSSLETLKTEKEVVEGKFNTATETITSLNSVVEELTPFKEQVVKANFEKALNEKSEVYKAKFEAVNAVSEFETEEVQNLIKLSLNEDEEGKNAIFQLNSKLVDLVVLPKKEDSAIRETASKRENLIPTSDSFESRYSL
jgi:hypothetical protein